MEHIIPPLDHGAIGNGRVLALVAPTTRIEWLCLPRFDSPSIFGGLLDPDRGGSFSFELAGEGAQMEMAYVVNTNVLRTRVTVSDGVFDVFDYAPRVPAGATVDAPLEVHRLLSFRLDEPRFFILSWEKPTALDSIPAVRRDPGRRVQPRPRVLHAGASRRTP